MATAIDLALRIQIVNDEEDDIQDLGVSQVALVTVERGEVGNAVLLQHIQKLKLGTRQLGLDLIHLSREADVDIRVGAGEYEQIFGEEQAGFDGEGMGLGADKTGDGQAYGAVAVVDDLQLAFPASALELDHISRQIEKANGAENTASAVGATVGNGGALFVQYHNGFLPARSGRTPSGREFMLQASVYACNTEGATPKRDTLRVNIRLQITQRRWQPR